MVSGWVGICVVYICGLVISVCVLVWGMLVCISC